MIFLQIFKSWRKKNYPDFETEEIHEDDHGSESEVEIENYDDEDAENNERFCSFIKQKEAYMKKQKEEKEKLKIFQEKVESQINTFLQDDTQTKHKFEPMDQVYRSIILDVAEVAGLAAFSFGDEGVDRHVAVYKREFAPGEDELAALRRGEEWTPEKARELAEKRELEKKLEEESLRKKPEKFIPNSNYKEKYEHLIGREAALAAAAKTQMNKSYGFVPSENKKDNRSIEQTLADIQTKKKQKTSHNPSNSPL
ncbi:sperm-associated antigen 7 isoform X2 [Anabrus simplex]|uniref:sperm-associated antigen 7 isoform X2 n=1 Tax=Anabrus simplex TaxID=316456 RepID=UPI0034DDB7CC